MPGTLFIIATPIGNLEDISYRAVRILGECDVVACEDTRQTRKLFDHYGIRTPTISLHEHNEQARAAELLTRIQDGAHVGLVSDAGTPLISDPGYRLVSALARQGIPIVPIPGPSAILAALSASGLETDAFRFCGFLPPKSSQKRLELESRRDENCTLIYYEAPHRVLESLDAINDVMPERPVVAAREITKIHEEFLRGTAKEIAQILRNRPSVQGEFTLLLGKPQRIPRIADPAAVQAAVEALVEQGKHRMDAIKSVAREFGIPKGQVYRMVERDLTPEDQ